MPDPFLISYDIANRRRLARLHRALRRRAVAIQYSVFLGQFTRAGLAELRGVINAIIDPRADDVRIYPVPAEGWHRRLGRPVTPEGILLTLLPEPFRPGPAPEPRADAGHTTSRRAGSGPRGRLPSLARHVRTGQRRGLLLL